MKFITTIILTLLSLVSYSQNIEYTEVGSKLQYSTDGATFMGGVRYYNPTPENDTIYFSSEQPATLDQVSIIFQTKTNQDTIWVDWGEDAPVWISGTTDQTKVSSYSAGSKTYNVKIYGDVDKITKFSVNELYVTFGDMSNNIGKMTGLTYLHLRRCSGVATCDGDDIPTGLTYWYWDNLPNLTATINSADIPTGVDYWYWRTLPNLTANGLAITALSKALTAITMTTITLSTARVDELLASMDAFYAGANLMTENATITLNGTGVGAPTGGASNTNIVSLTSKATSQGKMWTFVINTP